MSDQIVEYELACLLEDVEKEARRGMPGDCMCMADSHLENIVKAFEKARTYGVIRYPVPA